MKAFIVSLLVLCGLSTAVYAEGYQADIERGQVLATAQCESCHGNVVITMAKQFPNLKGQKIAYLNKQLVDFKTGLRVDPLMQAQVSALSSDQLQDVALFYSQQVTPNLSAN
ncbi:MAG: c-type cytochrome [Gammaproteobacteria bacterium]|uniref:C-type cytochrome n=1 Tax=Shewanella vaxholmensis TaxID=3063535 RepID=A0ABU9UVN5_9GAMM|nr:c-type cytochrome [Shewanella sp. SP1S1-4]MBU1391264.1 c-type cytochrome [Gammaproteobacteria bacterium]MBU1475985.1 c-type cytochrome [Gammaproteobacteria bacterium]MBU2001267.1 c-type cytochrome [Gammaproteobacteria bacterium]MBU2133180.1 c-type cytochrome [Gammaproteobacteria bacterium]MBU2187302.1 c-type cytochrome [Gammaproteobacteria bacterium]